MITRAEAIDIANNYLIELKTSIDEACPSQEGNFIIINTVSFSYGWLFYFAYEQYLNTNGKEGLIFGHGPFLVEKKNGRIHILSTRGLPEEELSIFEKNKGYFSLKRKLRLIWFRLVNVIQGYP